MYNRLSLIALGLFVSLMLFNYAGAAPTIVPCTGTGNPANIACGFINVTNTTIDVGQRTVITINGINGGAPGVNGYTADWNDAQQGFGALDLGTYNTIFSNTISLVLSTYNSITVNDFEYNGIAIPANLIVSGYYSHSAAPRTEVVNAILEDLPGANTLTTNDIPLLTINPAFNYGSTNPSGSYDEGQTVSMTAYASGGTPSYTYNFLICPPSSCSTPIVNSLVVTSATSNTFSWVSTQTGTNLHFDAKESDSASTPESSSGSQPFNVNSTPTVTSFTQSNSVVDLGQADVFNAVLSGGSGPFTVNFVYANNGVVARSVTGVAKGGYAHFAFFPTVAGSYTFDVNANDVGTFTPFAFGSSVTLTLTANTDPAIPSFTQSNSGIDIGQTDVFNTVLSGGAGPFIVNVIYSNNGVLVGSATGIAIGGYTHISFTPTATGSYTFAVNANDVGTTTPYGFRTDTILPLTVNSVPTLTLSPSSGTYSPGETETWTVSVSGGTGPFTIALYNTTSRTQVGSNVTILGTGGSNTITFTAGPSGTYTYNAIASDKAIVPWIVFNTTPVAVTVRSSGGGSSTTTATTTTSTTTTVQASTTTAATTAATTTVPSNPQQSGNFTLSQGGSQNVSFGNGGASFIIGSMAGSSGNVNYTIVNVTPAPAAPPGYIPASPVLNATFNTNANVTINVMLKYNCSLPASSVAPQEFVNGSWKAITPYTVNATACTVAFSISKDPEFGVFSNYTAPAPSSSTSVSSSSTPTTVVTTPQSSPGSGIGTSTIVEAIVVVIIIAAIAYYATRKKR